MSLTTTPTNGYAQARRVTDRSSGWKDRRCKIREVRLHVPVDEGERYRIGKLDISGIPRSGRIIPPFFKVQEGDIYSKKKILKGYDKAKEVYGAGGFWNSDGAGVLVQGDRSETGKPTCPTPSADRRHHAAHERGQAILVNRITFIGNTTTRDTGAP